MIIYTNSNGRIYLTNNIAEDGEYYDSPIIGRIINKIDDDYYVATSNSKIIRTRDFVNYTEITIREFNPSSIHISKLENGKIVALTFNYSELRVYGLVDDAFTERLFSSGGYPQKKPY